MAVRGVVVFFLHVLLLSYLRCRSKIKKECAHTLCVVWLFFLHVLLLSTLVYMVYVFERERETTRDETSRSCWLFDVVCLWNPTGYRGTGPYQERDTGTCIMLHVYIVRKWHKCSTFPAREAHEGCDHAHDRVARVMPASRCCI